ncbi:MAG: hypothetical protein L6V78_00020 [Clostridium sp.]|nr:MAG: hypothetical protein L6V78_00020 [Clostridium sp.]
MKDAIAIGVGIKSNKIIDEVNIYEATKLAMKDAINNLSVKPEHVFDRCYAIRTRYSYNQYY